MLTSPTESLSSASSTAGSPIAQSPHPNAWFPPIPRRRADKTVKFNLPRLPRYYATPLNEDTDSTPLQVYGLEQREPSIAEKPKLLRRMSHALDDIKEDFSLQLEPRERLKSRNRHSTFMLDTSVGGSGLRSSGSSLSGGESPMTSEPPRPRPISTFSIDNWNPPAPAQSLSRRLSNRLGFSQKKRFRPGQGASISQPNLIGSSTQM
ncbi:hypothetical protein P170DRAFT_349473 [Aspergillus steynii IBT 23096]|uniref:Uncharacterized protein n=1 Tax=Aspergillus steynii IBT 23096 TaxID=1392250 RepID=A0A2I2GKJ9_9EURO|nr:uncharacterized protein P170DRAFT_349473 [Aspergillus steynii IBT 23096]PLB53411.1 hypothetical protein P170DRAFT_349473 [Aspergillus steynii IBT 23096]